jgi:WD40 repeat protein
MLRDFAPTSLLAGLLILTTGFAAETPPPQSQPRGRILALQGRVGRPAFSPDSKLVATLGADGRVTLWDVATAEPAGPPLELGHKVTTGAPHGDRRGLLSFSPDGRSLVWWSEDEVAIWDVATRQVIGRPIGAGARIFKGVSARSVMGFSPGGDVLLLETRDGFVLWSISKRGPMGPPLKDVLGGRDVAGPRIRFSPDGRIVAAATKDGVIVWDVAKAESTGPVLKPRDDLPELVFSPDGRILTAVSSDEAILWDVGKREMAGVLNRGGGGISKALWGADSQVVFSPDGRSLAWLSNHGQYSRAGEIVLWDVAKRKPIVPPLSGHPKAQTVQFSPDSKMMATGGNDHSVILWDVWSGRPIGDPLLIGGKIRYGRSGVGVLSLAFSASGATLVARTSEPSLLELWDVAHQPARLVRRFDHRPFGAVDSQNKTLAIGRDGHLALWDLSSQEARDQPVFVPGFEGDRVAFSPDGATLATYKDAKTGTVITLRDVATLMPPDRNR